MMPVWLLVAWSLGVSPVAEATKLRVDEFDAGRFDYCESQQANQEFLARVEAQADRGHPSIRRIEQATVELVREGIALASRLPSPAHCRAVFESGHEIFREALASNAAAARRNEPFEPAEDRVVKRARLEILGQWIQDEAARHVWLALPDDSQDPAMEWATAQANARMKTTAVNSASVVSLVYEEFGNLDPAILGPAAARQATQLAERHGVPASFFEPRSRRGNSAK